MDTFINLFIASFLVLLPFLIYNVFADIISKKKKIPVKTRKYIDISLFFSLFYLQLFLIYKKQDITDSIRYLTESVNIKFILVSCLISFFILLGHFIFKKKAGTFDVNFKRIPVYIIVSLLVFFFLMNTSFVVINMYGIISTEQIIYHIMLTQEGANYSIINKAAAVVFPQTFISLILSLYILSVKINLEIRKRKKEIFIPFAKFRKISVFFAVLLPVAGLVYMVNILELPQYIKINNKNPSGFYEENYIFPKQVKIDFPERKRNLMVILVESLETGFLTINDGGAFTEDLMPEIASLAKDNINFSINEEIGGPVQLFGAEWTIAGTAAYYSGLPFAIRFFSLKEWNNYGFTGDEFLPGACSLGDILYDAGYKSYYFYGSEVEFGGTDKYFKTHKNTVFYDYTYFQNNKYIPDDYRVWWGIEDRKLYELAKIKISELSREEPFFVTLSTLDTHPTEGYLDEQAERLYNSQFKNVIRDMSRQLYAFIDWLKQQDFYENTTIVILGDHLYQDTTFFPDNFKMKKLSPNYNSRYFTGNTLKSNNRYPINIFINSLLDSSKVKNRAFSHFDMLPVIIESVGGIINAEGLALGRSMTKGTTLIEKYGEAQMNRQLRLKSNLYDSLWKKSNK